MEKLSFKVAGYLTDELKWPRVVVSANSGIITNLSCLKNVNVRL
jgi:hypothetical protein